MNRTKISSSQVAWSLLAEGITQARVDVHRLRLLCDRAISLVEASEKRDHLFQVAGDMIQGIPERITSAERALDRTSYALSVMGEDFLRGRISLEDRDLVDGALKTSPFSGSRAKESGPARVAQRFLASASRPTKPDTDFRIEEDDGIWAVIGTPSKFVYSAHGSQAEAEKALDEWLDAIPARKKSAIRVVGRFLEAASGDAPSAEFYFFHNPETHEVRQFDKSDALSNKQNVAVNSVEESDSPDRTVSEAKAEAKRAPPTPAKILKEPGGEEFSTLNRFLIMTEQPGVTGVPESRDEIPKHPKLAYPNPPRRR